MENDACAIVFAVDQRPQGTLADARARRLDVASVSLRGRVPGASRSLPARKGRRHC